MKKTSLIFICLLAFVAGAMAQSSFEGIIKYKVDLRPKNGLGTEKSLQTVFATGPEAVYYAKPGLARESNGLSDLWYISAKQKAYVLYKGLDTLYELDYSEDTTSILKMVRSGEKTSIAGYDCEVLLIEGYDKSEKHFYAPALYVDPAYDSACKLGHFGAYIKATSSQWLGYTMENGFAIQEKRAVSVEKKSVDESVFALPPLPVKRYAEAVLVVEPEFTGKGGWQRYVNTSVDANLAVKYIKLRKGEPSAVQQVKVRFVIDEKGEVTDVVAVDSEDVHPKLREEAVRVVRESPRWKPGSVRGTRIPFYRLQPVTFMVVR